MSETTKKAIYSLLATDATLAALLGTDENGVAAIFNANMNSKLQDQTTPGASWTYPCITFRESSGTPDARFTSGLVEYEYFDIEVWWQDNSALTGARISGRLDTLLHNTSLTVDSGTCYDCTRVSKVADNYDDKSNTHFSLLRYQLVVSS